ncbi:MAG: transcription antitermination factor NusB [Oscillospiraceae bacterium]|nr:transcription antitermination factor NusB [Oscillospiraceae bacterium]
MTRTVARQIAVRICFSEDFLNDTPDAVLDEFFEAEHYHSLIDDDELFSAVPDRQQMDYIRKLVTCVYEHSDEIDRMISSYSEKRKLERIPKTALSVLRCAVCELMYFEDIPSSVTINEAVEIAKGFDSPETVSFINGLLGSVYRSLNESN